MGGVSIRYLPPSYGGPSARHDQCEPRYSSSSVTQNDGYHRLSNDAGTQTWFMAHGDVSLSHLTTARSRLVDNTTQAISAIIHDANPSAYVGPSVSGLYCNTGYEEIARVSTGSPPVGTSSVRPWQPKARKKNGTAQRENHKIKRTLHSKAQCANPQQELIQVSISKYIPVLCRT